MTEIQAISPVVPGNRILKFVAFLYGLVAYFTFFATILYAIGFVDGMVVPKTIDTGSQSSVTQALVVNLLLMFTVRCSAQLDGAKAIQAMVDAIRAEIGRA